MSLSQLIMFCIQASNLMKLIGDDRMFNTFPSCSLHNNIRNGVGILFLDDHLPLRLGHMFVNIII